jgi:hypothetical protein
VHVVEHQMPLLDPAFLLRCQLLEHLARMPAKLPVQRPPATLRDEYHVVFALPRAVAQTLKLVRRDSSNRVLGASRSEVSAMDTPLDVKLLLPPRHSRGASLGC